MKTFLAFLNEKKVNFNPKAPGGAWQVRGDESHHPFNYERSHIVLKNVKPHVDHDAHTKGKMIYAYLKGDPTEDRPTSETHTQRSVKFERDNLKHPFKHTDDGSPMHHADYVEFKGKTVTAHYKK